MSAIKHKRKDAASYTWTGTDLEVGQLGLNVQNGTIHLKKSVAGGSEYVTFSPDTKRDPFKYALMRL